MGNNPVPKFIFRLSRFPVYRGSVLGRFYCILKSLWYDARSEKHQIMTMLGPILSVWLLKQSEIFPSSVFHIRRTRQNSPPSDFYVFGLFKEAMGEGSLSGPTKRCSRRCTSGCTLSQKTFFSRGIHALPKRWNTCMERNGDYIEKWCHCVPCVFNKLQDKDI